MKKVIWMMMAAVLISTPTLAGLGQQSGSALFDMAKAQKEIEIMQSIIETALGHSSRRADAEPVVYTTVGDAAEVLALVTGRSGIDGFYLYGQGTSFIIGVARLPSNPTADYEKLEAEIEELKNSDLSPSFKALQLRYLENQAKRRRVRSRGLGVGSASFGPTRLAEAELAYIEAATVAAEAGKVAEAPRAPRVRGQQVESDVTEAEVAERIAKLEATVAEAKQKAAAEHEKVMANRKELKTELLEIVGTHGDSLTHLGDDEYINLILSSKTSGWYSASRGSRGPVTQILSIKKSDVKAYKAGSIDFDTLKSRVLEYSY